MTFRTDRTGPPVARLVSHRERVKKQDRAVRPTRGRPVRVFFGALVMLACGVGLVLALALTAHLIIAGLYPDLLQGPFRLEKSTYENLSAGAIFFWLELLAIVGGLRLYDEIRGRVTHRVRNRDQLYDIHVQLANLIDEINDYRYSFAVRLDENYDGHGRYTTSLSFLEVSIKFLRDRFLVKELSNPDLTSTARKVLNDIVVELDEMIEDIFWAVDDALKLNTGTTELTVLDDALNRIFEECDPYQTNGLQQIFLDLTRMRDAA